MLAQQLWTGEPPAISLRQAEGAARSMLRQGGEERANAGSLAAATAASPPSSSPTTERGVSVASATQLQRPLSLPPAPAPPPPPPPHAIESEGEEALPTQAPPQQHQVEAKPQVAPPQAQPAPPQVIEEDTAVRAAMNHAHAAAHGPRRLPCQTGCSSRPSSLAAASAFSWR